MLLALSEGALGMLNRGAVSLPHLGGCCAGRLAARRSWLRLCHHGPLGLLSPLKL